MGQAISARTDYAIDEVRGFAKRSKDAAQARRRLAIAAVLEGATRENAARIGGMDRQTLQDGVIRFNEQGPEGLKHGAFSRSIVEEGPRAQTLSQTGEPDAQTVRITTRQLW